MNDTPRTGAAQYYSGTGMRVDADFARQLERELAQEKRHTEVVMRTLKDALGIEDGRDCLEEVGRLKEVEAQHRILTLIAERDSARTQADRKWRLREEFEALLGTSDVETGVERVKEAQKGATRYEYIRKLDPREFAALSLFCITSGIHFDTAVDRRMKET